MITINKYQLIYKTSFKKELKQINEYIRKKLNNKIACLNLFLEISNKILIFQEYPYAFQTLYNYKYQNKVCKRLVVENYSIIYYILEKEKTVVIIHIFYSKRKFLNS